MGFIKRLVYGTPSPTPEPPDHAAVTALVEEERRLRSDHARIREQINMTNLATIPPIEEERLWGRTQGTEEDYYWRRLSDNWYQKDVIPATYLEIHNRVYEAYNANPLAGYIIELTTNFVVGEKVTFEAKSPKVQKILEDFWRDPDNHMDRRVISLCTELSLYGEQFVRFFVNPYSGRVKVAQIDPSLIDQIETDPDNVEKNLRFHQRPVGPGGAMWSATAPIGGAPPSGAMLSKTGIITAPDPKAFEPTQEPGAIYAPGDQVMAGIWYEAGREVIQFKINSVSNAKRGKSDLATLLPWLRRYQDWLIDRVRVNKYKAAFLWDVQLNGADAKTIDRKRMQYAYAPNPGSVIVHNESETWSAVQPKIEADDVASDGHAIKMMVAMGAGLPEHYLAEGGDVNRATAAEMGLPTYRKLKRRQEEVRGMVECILDRVLDEAIKAGKLSPRVDRAYTLELPAIAPGDEQTDAAAASSLIATLLSANQAGWVSRETGQRLLFNILDPETNMADEQARITAEGPPQPIQPPTATSQPHTPSPRSRTPLAPNPLGASK